MSNKTYKVIIDKFIEFKQFQLDKSKSEASSISDVDIQVEANKFSDIFKLDSNKTIRETSRIPLHKNVNNIIIVPVNKIRHDKSIKIWYNKYVTDISNVFKTIINIFYENEIDFSSSENNIYNKFVEFLYKSNMNTLEPKTTYYNKLYKLICNDDLYNNCNINNDFNEFFGDQYSKDIYNAYNDLIKYVEILDTILPYKLEDFFMSFVDKVANLYDSDSEDDIDSPYSEDDV